MLHGALTAHSHRFGMAVTPPGVADSKAKLMYALGDYGVMYLCTYVHVEKRRWVDHIRSRGTRVGTVTQQTHLYQIHGGVRNTNLS